MLTRWQGGLAAIVVTLVTLGWWALTWPTACSGAGGQVKRLRAASAPLLALLNPEERTAAEADESG